ncbi:MAG: hypothetical protein PSY12_06070 [bacterium]|nr:hypothetical protein [bacterium]
MTSHPNSVQAAIAYPDMKVTVAGFKDEIDAAKWLIAEATHQLDRSGGFGTDIKMEMAA